MAKLFAKFIATNLKVIPQNAVELYRIDLNLSMQYIALGLIVWPSFGWEVSKMNHVNYFFRDRMNLNMFSVSKYKQSINLVTSHRNFFVSSWLLHSCQLDLDWSNHIQLNYFKLEIKAFGLAAFISHKIQIMPSQIHSALTSVRSQPVTELDSNTLLAQAVLPQIYATLC